jgi:hypothetical protein
MAVGCWWCWRAGCACDGYSRPKGRTSPVGRTVCARGSIEGKPRLEGGVCMKRRTVRRAEGSCDGMLYLSAKGTWV